MSGVICLRGKCPGGICLRGRCQGIHIYGVNVRVYTSMG